MRSVALCISLLAAQLAWGAESVVIGTVSSDVPMNYAPIDCPKDAYCLHSWWKTEIHVQRIVHGPALPSSVAAAFLKHASLNSNAKTQTHLFVLRPIDDPAERAKLRVAFYLVEMATPLYCFSNDPKDYGLDLTPSYVFGTDDKSYCFEIPSG